MTDTDKIAETPEAVARQWVDDNPEWFEKTVLWWAIKDLGMWRVLAPLVCIDDAGAACRDFSVPLHSSVYQIIAGQRRALGTAVDGRISREAYALAVIRAAASGTLIGQSELAAAMALFDELDSQNYTQMREVVLRGIGYWLNKQRTGAIITRELTKRNWDADTVTAKITAAVGNVNRRMSPTTHIAEFATSMMNRKMERTECLTSGLHGLDMLLGGGFHRGDGHLIIAATGVGKTVCFTQLAMEFALNGYVVAAITTEQPMEQLEPRFISNKCSIPFSQIGRGFTLHTLSPEQRTRAMRLMRSVVNRLFIFDWRKQRKSVMAGGIEEEVAYCKQRTGRCDVVLLDWLGGALTDDVQGDKDKKRLAIQCTADRMAYLASELNIPTITFAQAHKVQGINNMYVGVKEVPECKTLDQAMAVVIGMTGMLSDKAKKAIQAGENPHGMALYNDDQNFYMSKGRYSQGGHARFKRQFGFQRMADNM